MDHKPENSVATKFLIRFVGIQFIAFVVAVILVVSGYSKIAHQYVRSQALQFMDVMMAVREYTSRKVNPVVAPINAISDEAFLPAAVPSYSATKVFEYLRLNHAYEDFQYREASTNPTSPADLATSEEALIIRRFEEDPTLLETSGFRKSSSDHPQFFVAKPIRLTKESCLTCHSTPNKAPRSQLLAYGSKSGFGWQLGDVVGAQIVTLPEDAGLPSPARFVLLLVVAIGVLTVLIILAVNRVFERVVMLPLSRLLRLARNEQSRHNVADSQDEFGFIARVLQGLRSSTDRFDDDTAH